MLETNLELFLDNYISHTKVLNSKFVANRYCKEVLNIPPEDLTRKEITEKLKNLRSEISQQFLEIIKKRKYRRENSTYFAN